MTEGCAARQSRVVCLSVRPALAWTKDSTCWTVVFWPRCGESPPLGPTAAASPGLSEQSGVSSHGAGSRPPRQRCPADPRPRPAVNPSKPPSGEGPPWHQPAAGPRAQDTHLRNGRPSARCHLTAGPACPQQAARPVAAWPCGWDSAPATPRLRACHRGSENLPVIVTSSQGRVPAASRLYRLPRAAAPPALAAWTAS